MSSRVLHLGDELRCVVADNPGPMTLDGTRSYLVGSEGAVVLDPGPSAGLDERLDALVGDARPGMVCLTHAHPDHAGGAARAARRLGVPLAASAATLGRLGQEGVALADGEKVALDGGATVLRVLSTPGHSADHTSYLRLPGGELFTGDLVLGSGTAMVGDPDGHMGSYLASLERLIELAPTRILPGHGDPVGDPVARLREYHRHRQEREAQIERAVAEGAGSVAEIRREVYGRLPDGLDWAAAASIRAHLVHLEECGKRLPEIQGREAGLPEHAEP
ncbi:MAG TPA: MBL fold metallo-hydrolase [Gemmatimonadota bacterium]|nr:MBL fold metallo-hydrolase [Gemmatimonadota bacterium]